MQNIKLINSEKDRYYQIAMEVYFSLCFMQIFDISHRLYVVRKYPPNHYC